MIQNQFKKLFDREFRFIFNIDEKKLKVILPDKILPLVVSPPVFPHITAIISICAAGNCIEPLILLPNKKTTRNIESHIDECFLASTESGWINKDNLFYIRFYSVFKLHNNSIPGNFL